MISFYDCIMKPELWMKSGKEVVEEDAQSAIKRSVTYVCTRMYVSVG